MAGWIKMPLGTEVLGLSPGHIVLDGDPAPPPRKGPCLLSLAKRSSISATAALLCKVTTHGVFLWYATNHSHQKRAKTLWHLGRNSSALGSELSLGHFGTSADLSTQFGPTKLMPKCPGSEVSVIRMNSQAPNSTENYGCRICLILHHYDLTVIN